MSPSPTEIHSPTSPFLQNLTRRLRAGSSASRTSSQSSDPQTTDQAQAQDTRSTKAYLASILRDDWEYPDSTTPGQRPHDAASYRFRDESVSEYESNDHEKDYKFDSPDDVGATITRRKARKRRLLEQEMSWNEGLRVWSMRRDAWAGVVQKKPRLSQDSTKDSASTSSASLHDEEGPYLPIYPPLLPASHTLRARISANSYPTIYSKVVVQGLAPNVPIPLNHMIGALVNGWKLEGNWPPQGSEPAKVVKKRGQKSAFKRWKAEQEEKKIAAREQAQAIEWEQDGHKGKRRSIGGVVKKALGLGVTGESHEDEMEKMGLVFETDEEQYEQAIEVLKTTQIA